MPAFHESGRIIRGDTIDERPASANREGDVFETLKSGARSHWNNGQWNDGVPHLATAIGTAATRVMLADTAAQNNNNSRWHDPDGFHACQLWFNASPVLVIGFSVLEDTYLSVAAEVDLLAGDVGTKTGNDRNNAIIIPPSLNFEWLFFGSPIRNLVIRSSGTAFDVYARFAK